MSTMLSECGACGLWKIATDFYRDVRYPDAWVPRSSCRVCYAQRRKVARVHWLAKVCTGCKRMVSVSGFYLDKTGAPHMPCKSCRATYRAPAVTVSEKQCVRCQRFLPASDFSPSRSHSDRLESACRQCRNAYRANSISVPTEKCCSVCKEVKPSDDFYRTNKHLDGLYSRCKDCHNERAAPGQAKYRTVNQERVQGWLREWNRTNQEARRVINHRRRAAKHAVESNFTRKQWAALKEAYEHCCAYCGKPSQRLTIDHVIPLSKGGPHTIQNIVPACNPCNSSKKDREAPPHRTHSFS